jgi:hypothetical protein
MAGTGHATGSVSAVLDSVSSPPDRHGRDVNERVEADEALQPRGEDRDRIHDRRGVQHYYREDVPDLPDVAKADVQRGRDQASLQTERVR